LRGGDNQLIGGDFEDLGQLRHLGWQHIDDPVVGIDTRVELSGQAPREGRYALELSATSTSPGVSPQTIAGPWIAGQPLVWITSPPIRVTAGQIVEISGWVRLSQPIAGGIGGLEILDSLGGPELALRVRDASDWQPFRMIRGVTETSETAVTFALTGLGTANVDGVMVRALSPPVAKRLPDVTEAPGPVFPNSARRELFGPPRQQ
jgi:hypothetical protein